MSTNRAAKIKEIVEHPQTAATCLLILCLDEWGTDFFGWEPDTLIANAMTCWHAKIPEKNRDKIWSLVTHLTTDIFFSSFEGFLHICNSLDNHGASFEQFHPADVETLCWGITEAFMIDAPDTAKFNEEIVAYMNKRLEYEGFHHVPRVLKPYTRLDLDKEAVKANLNTEGIEYAAFWTNEQQKSTLIDELILTKLKTVFFQLGQLPLSAQHVPNLNRILQRAKKALAEQEQTTSEASELIPQPLL
jgi:hypothetical protein